MSLKSEKPPKLLVICVDRDNDIGEKTQFKTPIIGKENCLNAAQKFALADPEEADVNTIFASVKQYDDLKKTGYDAEVAIVSGLFKRGVKGDQKILLQVKQIIQGIEYDGAVLVSDGVDDEQVIPIIQNIIPVISIKRVIIRQSKSVEESYVILGRYLKMLFLDPRYSRLSLGLPGILLFISAFLISLDLARESIIISLAIIGLVLAIRGFELDKIIVSKTKLSEPSIIIRLVSHLASILIIAVAFYGAFTIISLTPQFQQVANNPSLFFENAPYLIGGLIQESINLVSIGLAIEFLGGVLYGWINQSGRIWRDILGLMMIAILYLPILQFSLILSGQGNPVTLVTWLLMGIAITFGIAVGLFEYIKKRRSYSEET